MAQTNTIDRGFPRLSQNDARARRHGVNTTEHKDAGVHKNGVMATKQNNAGVRKRSVKTAKQNGARARKRGVTATKKKKVSRATCFPVQVVPSNKRLLLALIPFPPTARRGQEQNISSCSSATCWGPFAQTE